MARNDHRCIQRKYNYRRIIIRGDTTNNTEREKISVGIAQAPTIILSTYYILYYIIFRAISFITDLT